MGEAMARYQSGHVFEAHGAFHVRYYTSAIVDGTPKRVQRSKWLCKKDNKHHSRTCKAVKQLAATEMEKVNSESGVTQHGDISVTDFWDTIYLPHVEKTTKPSTLSGYKAIWRQHLSAVFAGFNLRDYQTHHATRYLTSLADKGLGPKTIAHIRSLASGMFKHALRLNYISVNPWRDAGSLTPIKKTEATHAYTLEAAEAISNALIDNPPAQVIFCLAAFLGLRPGEISALKWQDVEWNDDGVSWIHIRRAAWRSFVGTTKTEESVASVPLIEPVKSILLAWKKLTAGEWVFPNRSSKPMQMEGFQKRVIAPVLAANAALKEKKIAWHGLYAGRRAAATLLVQLTGNAVAAQFVLRHKNLTTTTAFYVKPVQTAGVEGMKLVEETLVSRNALSEANGK
jgi:integrase